MEMQPPQETSERFRQKCGFYFSRIRNAPPEKPYLVIVDVTHKCNLQCKMCDIYKDLDLYNAGKELATGDILAIIDQCVEWGVNQLVLSGGEAFLRSDIFQIIEYVARKGFHLGVITNATLLTESVLQRILPFLTNRNLSLTISVDGSNARTHDEIRGVPGSFDRTMRVLRRLAELKEAHQIRVGVISVVMDPNLEELADIAQMLKALKVDDLRFQALVHNNLRIAQRFKGDYWVKESRQQALTQALARLSKFKLKNPDLLMNHLPDLALMRDYFSGALKPKDVKCYFGFRTMLIANDGRLTTCYADYGSVREKTLKECWHSLEAERARQKVKDCPNPCLLACFTDYELDNLPFLCETFLDSVQKQEYPAEEELTILNSAVTVLEGYEKELTQTGGSHAV